MTSFRKANSDAARSGRFASGSGAASPFSQAQILHLMKTEFARARRYGFPVSCLLVQVDRLDALVDMHGGVLRELVRDALGKLVQDKTRGADHLGFASDDRHILVMPHTGGEAALQVAERLGRAFHELEFRVGTNELALRLSIGVASCDDQATLFFDTMLTQAEAALEDAARSGGNQCSLFRKGQIDGLRDEDVEGEGDGIAERRDASRRGDV